MKSSILIGLPIRTDTWDRHQTVEEVLIEERGNAPLIITNRREMYGLGHYIFGWDTNKELIDKIKIVFPEEFI